MIESLYIDDPAVLDTENSMSQIVLIKQNSRHVFEMKVSDELGFDVHIRFVNDEVRKLSNRFRSFEPRALQICFDHLCLLIFLKFHIIKLNLLKRSLFYQFEY